MAGDVSFSRAAPIANRVAVISPKYCCPSELHIGIVKELRNRTTYAMDTDDNIILKVTGVLTIIHPRRVVHDDAGNPVVTMKRKAMTAHHRWRVYKGKSTKFEDLIFTVKTSSVHNLRTKLDVFLANNTNEEVPDFKVKGSWFNGSCTVYAGDDSSTIIAEMQKLNGCSGLKINPNIDHAFIITLFDIFIEINRDRHCEPGQGDGSGSRAGSVAGKVIGGVITSVLS